MRPLGRAAALLAWWPAAAPLCLLLVLLLALCLDLESRGANLARKRRREGGATGERTRRTRDIDFTVLKRPFYRGFFSLRNTCSYINWRTHCGH